VKGVARADVDLRDLLGPVVREGQNIGVAGAGDTRLAAIGRQGDGAARGLGVGT